MKIYKQTQDYKIVYKYLQTWSVVSTDISCFYQTVAKSETWKLSQEKDNKFNDFVYINKCLQVTQKMESNPCT